MQSTTKCPRWNRSQAGGPALQPCRLDQPAATRASRERDNHGTGHQQPSTSAPSARNMPTGRSRHGWSRPHPARASAAGARHRRLSACSEPAVDVQRASTSNAPARPSPSHGPVEAPKNEKTSPGSSAARPPTVPTDKTKTGPKIFLEPASRCSDSRRPLSRRTKEQPSVWLN